MDKVEMEYVGEGTKPPNIFVLENEVEALEKAGGWIRKTVADRDRPPGEAKPAEAKPNPGKSTKPAEEKGVTNG